MSYIQRISKFKYLNRLLTSSSSSSASPSIYNIVTNNSNNNNNYHNNTNINNDKKIKINNNNIKSITFNNGNRYLKQYYSSSSSSLNSNYNNKQQKEEKQEEKQRDSKYNLIMLDAFENFKNKDIIKCIESIFQGIVLCNDIKLDAYLLRADIKSEFNRTYRATCERQGIIFDYRIVSEEIDNDKKAYIHYSASKAISKLNVPERDSSEAISLLDKALALDPNNLLYLKDKILIGSNLNDPSIISETSTQLLKEDPDKYGKLSLAIIKSMKREDDQAIEILSSIIDENKDLVVIDKDQDSTCYFNRLIMKEDVNGYLRVREKYYFQSENILFDSYLILGNLYCRQGQYELCCSTFRKALKLQPWAYQLHSIMGSLAYRLGKYRECIQHCNDFFAVDQDFESPYAKQSLMDRGSSNYYLSNKLEAIDDLSISLERPWFFDNSRDISNQRANPSLLLIDCYSYFIQLCPGLDKSKFNIDQLIRDTDNDQILFKEPSNIHELYSHVEVFFKVYSDIYDWVGAHPLDYSIEEKNIITTRTSLFSNMKEYLVDSLYLNYISNPHEEFYDPDRPGPYKNFNHFLYLLNYKESNQLESRQQGHITLLNLYKNLLHFINKNDF
ncbi:hypothetical protein CYY_001604 [Polysphondylium violaceum]|uniref:TPR repeat-containing protein n=1 Tax=Polysphondylium violaceum TaxID=133409 RepID=A0A8J4Q1L3_9MYCE|nr:hypothetical protein CYY_001604 [Polysphondylium violaceum]